MNFNQPKCILALTLLALQLVPTTGATKEIVKLKLNATLTAGLSATSAAPVGANGWARISVTEKKEIQAASLNITANGLANGVYQIDGILEDGTAVDLGALQTPMQANGVVVPVPETLDALEVVSLAISDSDGTVLLEGALSVSTDFLVFIGNVRVTAPDFDGDRGPGANKVHGRALAHTVIIKNQEKQRQFLFVGFGAEPNALLTINVDDVEMGTVTATEQGKVKFKFLGDIYLPALGMVTLTDATGAVVMQADFDPLD